MQSNSYLQYPLYSLSSKAWVLIAQVGSSSEFAFFDQNLQAVSAAELGICLDLREGVSYGHYYAIAGKIYRRPYSATTGMLINLAQEFRPENLPPANPWVSLDKIALQVKDISEQLEPIAPAELAALYLVRENLVAIRKIVTWDDSSSLSVNGINLAEEPIDFAAIPCTIQSQTYKDRNIVPYINFLLIELKKVVQNNPAIYLCALKAVLLGNINAENFAQFNLPTAKIDEILAEAWQLRFALIENGINKLPADPTLISQVYDYIVAVITAEIIKYDAQKNMVAENGQALNFSVRPAIPAAACAIGSLPVADGVKQLIPDDPSLSNDETALLHALNSFVQVDGWHRLENLSLEQLEVFLKILSICFDDNQNQNYSANDVSQAQRVLDNFIIMRRAVDYDNSQWPQHNNFPGFDHAREIELRNLKQEFEFQVSYRKHREIHDQLVNAIRENNFNIVNKILEEYVDTGIICLNRAALTGETALEIACNCACVTEDSKIIIAMLEYIGGNTVSSGEELPVTLAKRRCSLLRRNKFLIHALDIIFLRIYYHSYSDKMFDIFSLLVSYIFQENNGKAYLFDAFIRHGRELNNISKVLEIFFKIPMFAENLNVVESKFGRTLLQLAYDCNINYPFLLLEKGADPTIQDINGKNVFDRIKKNTDARLLIKHVNCKFINHPGFEQLLQDPSLNQNDFEKNELRKEFILKKLEGIEQGIVESSEFAKLVDLAFSFDGLILSAYVGRKLIKHKLFTEFLESSGEHKDSLLLMAQFIDEQLIKFAKKYDAQSQIKCEKFVKLIKQYRFGNNIIESETLLRELAQACHYQRNPRKDTVAVVLSFGIFGLYNRYKYGTFSHQAQSWHEFKKLKLPGLEAKHQEIIREIERGKVNTQATTRVRFC